MDAYVVVGNVLLDKYRVERILGQGGMGLVVAVRHIDLGQLHAMKFLLPDALRHPEAVERFLREAQAAALLRSHHVVRVHDVGRMPNSVPYMIMEYLEGCDLKRHLERQGPLSVDEVVTFTLQACDAIAEAHSVGIIHRDLKPANLFLAHQRNASPLVKVLDFGISKHTSPGKAELTDTNATLGSPLYMSPEQIAKSKTVDTGTDIWALGLIAYELFTGVSPFRASSVLEVAARVLQEEPRPLREVRPDAPEDLAIAITRCLRKRREDRWATVAEFAAALEEFVPQALAPRLSRTSVTNEARPEQKVALPSPTISTTIAALPNQTAPTLPVGEPTAITFGTTGKPNAPRRTRNAQFAMTVTLVFVGVGLVAFGLIWVLSKGPSEQKFTEAANGNEALVASGTSTVFPASITVATESPTNIVPADIQKSAPAKPLETPIQKSARKAAPIVTTNSTAKTAKSTASAERPEKAADPMPAPTSSNPKRTRSLD